MWRRRLCAGWHTRRRISCAGATSRSGLTNPLCPRALVGRPRRVRRQVGRLRLRGRWPLRAVGFGVGRFLFLVCGWLTVGMIGVDFKLCERRGGEEQQQEYEQSCVNAGAECLHDTLLLNHCRDLCADRRKGGLQGDRDGAKSPVSASQPEGPVALPDTVYIVAWLPRPLHAFATLARA